MISTASSSPAGFRPLTAPPPPPEKIPQPPTPTPPVQPDLPAHRLKRVEAAAADYQILMQERDDLDLRLHQAQQKIIGLEVQVASLKTMAEMVEGTAKGMDQLARDRVNKALEQRDEYADRALSLEATLAGIFSQLKQVIHGDPVIHDTAPTP